MLLRTLLKGLILPPALQFLLILLAWFALRRWPRLRVTVISLSLISLLLLSLPATTILLARSLESYPALDLTELNPDDYQAIVVLGSGRVRDAPEYGSDTATGRGLLRLQYAAYLHRQTGLPILVSGGLWGGDVEPEAGFMARILQRDFDVPVAWQEDQSRTTWENALNSYRLLKPQGITRILLVTHAWHMPRAMYSFRSAGFDVTAAPTQFISVSEIDAIDFIPSASGLYVTTFMLHEWLGSLVYRWSPLVD